MAGFSESKSFSSSKTVPSSEELERTKSGATFSDILSANAINSIYLNNLQHSNSALPTNGVFLLNRKEFLLRKESVMKL